MRQFLILFFLFISTIEAFILPTKNIQSLAWKKTFESRLFSSVAVENGKLTDSSYDMEAWKNGFSSCDTETCVLLEGVIPTDIEGTYFRNGHAKYEVGKEKVKHPFDADGMIAAISISNGTAIFRNKFVRTKGYIKEKRQKRILHRGAFGTQRKGGMFSNIFDAKVRMRIRTSRKKQTRISCLM